MVTSLTPGFPPSLMASCISAMLKPSTSTLAMQLPMMAPAT